MMDKADPAPDPGDCVILDGGSLTLAGVLAVARHGARVRLDGAAEARVRESRAWIDEVSRGEALTVYGVNTGFGSLAEMRIPPDDVTTLTRNLILSHCLGSDLRSRKR